MCLIITREPNVTLDKVKFDTAVLNNPDGWGISVPDMEGQLYTTRSVTTDKEELYDLLHGEFKGDRLLLHLRYTTAGDTVLRNSHPFPVLEMGTHGVDMRVAHNGTLTKWSPPVAGAGSWESDTRRFVRGYVRPLMERMIRGHSSEDVLSDPFVDTLLDNQLTSASVLAFIDGYGNTSVVNAKGNGGFTDDEGTYFSNKYSHDPGHRVPTPVTHGGSYKPMGKKTGTTTTTGRPATGTKATVAKKYFTDCVTQSFMEKYEVDDPADLALMSDETIQVLVEDEPEDAILLIKELLALHYRECRAVTSLVNNGALKDKQIKDLQDKLNVKAVLSCPTS